jgi:glucose/arabinose dehydrogenase
MRHLRLVIGLILLLTGLSVATTAAAAAPTGFSDTQIATVASPTGLAFTPDGRMLVTSQHGQIRVYQNGSLLPTPALDLSARICANSERGVLGIATDPNPAKEFVYVYFTPVGSAGTCPTANGTPNTPEAPRNRVSRFTLGDNNVINPASEVRLLDGIYSTGGYHNGGDLHVGKDGYLYVTTGDGGCDYLGDATHPGGSGCGGANDDSRDRNILNGKVLRITTTGAIPADNPFTGSGTARCQFAPAPTGQTCQET